MNPESRRGVTLTIQPSNRPTVQPFKASAAIKSSNPLHAAQSGKMYDGSLTRALRHVYKTEGFAGLYKGVTLAWVKAPIAVALSFTINDFLKQSVRTCL